MIPLEQRRFVNYMSRIFFVFIFWILSSETIPITNIDFKVKKMSGTSILSNLFMPCTQGIVERISNRVC